MKKLFFLSLAALALASCSNKEEDILNSQDVKLVDAIINIQIDADVATRSYLGEVDDKYSIAHSFEADDKVVISDYAGSYDFTVNENGQSTTLRGKWAEVKDDKAKGIIATFPKAAVASSLTKNTAGNPVMHFNLKTSQVSRVKKGASVDNITYDTEAGLAFACAETKGATLWFCPLVSYLYFYSTKPNCSISCDDQGIAGTYTVTYTGKHGTGTNENDDTYSTAIGLNQYLTYSASSNTIQCTGQKVAGHKNQFSTEGYGDAYEYVICIKPGTYVANTLHITPSGASGNFHNKADVIFQPSQVYFLGNVDQ